MSTQIIAQTAATFQRSPASPPPEPDFQPEDRVYLNPNALPFPELWKIYNRAADAEVDWLAEEYLDAMALRVCCRPPAPKVKSPVSEVTLTILVDPDGRVVGIRDPEADNPTLKSFQLDCIIEQLALKALGLDDYGRMAWKP